MFGTYDVNICKLEVLENQYLIKSEYDSYTKKLIDIDKIKYKFVFYFIGIFVSIIAFGAINSKEDISYLDVASYGLIGLNFLFFIVIILIVGRIKQLQKARDILYTKIVEMDIK